MPTIGWIDALRQYNAGMPSWCVPRKGTPGYERVMRIRQGEQTKGFKEVLEDLERKTAGKPKGEKKSMKIDLSTQSATLPTIAEAGPTKTDVPPSKSSGSNNKDKMAVEKTETDVDKKWQDIRWWKDDEFRILHMDGKIYPGKVYHFRIVVDPKPTSSVAHSIRAMEDGSLPPRVKRDKLTPVDESNPQEKAMLDLAKERLARKKEKLEGGDAGGKYTPEDKKRIEDILEMAKKTSILAVKDTDAEKKLEALRTEKKEKERRFNRLLKEQSPENREEREALRHRLYEELPKEIAVLRKQMKQKAKA